MKLTRKLNNSQVFTDPIVNGDGKPWILVQYSSGVNSVVYAIIHESVTVWKSENLYKDVVAYLSEGSTIYQGMILKRSIERHELDIILESIKEFSLSSKYPLEKDKIATIDYSLVRIFLTHSKYHTNLIYLGIMSY